MVAEAATTLLLEVHTARRRYFAPRSHVTHIGRAPEPGVAEVEGRPVVVHSLGPLLDPEDQDGPTQQALTVVLRRRAVVLLVRRIESLQPMTVQPLAPFLLRCLDRPWVLGAVVVSDDPVLVLDLRRIATDLALGAVGGGT